MALEHVSFMEVDQISQVHKRYLEILNTLDVSLSSFTSPFAAPSTSPPPYFSSEQTETARSRILRSETLVSILSQYSKAGQDYFANVWRATFYLQTIHEAIRCWVDAGYIGANWNHSHPLLLRMFSEIPMDVLLDLTVLEEVLVDVIGQRVNLRRPKSKMIQRRHLLEIMYAGDWGIDRLNKFFENEDCLTCERWRQTLVEGHGRETALLERIRACEATNGRLTRDLEQAGWVHQQDLNALNTAHFRLLESDAAREATRSELENERMDYRALREALTFESGRFKESERTLDSMIRVNERMGVTIDETWKRIWHTDVMYDDSLTPEDTPPIGVLQLMREIEEKNILIQQLQKSHDETEQAWKTHWLQLRGEVAKISGESEMTSEELQRLSLSMDEERAFHKAKTDELFGQVEEAEEKLQKKCLAFIALNLQFVEAEGRWLNAIQAIKTKLKVYLPQEKIEEITAPCYELGQKSTLDTQEGDRKKRKRSERDWVGRLQQ
ncbi:MAG: hypothetical protein M1833_004274 [Piccolia ochrophora]|nr:MAG: hypothetical protein M1833_004274 [Piccolia ochrophora]